MTVNPVASASVYSQLAETCNVPLDHASQTVRAGSADEEKAGLLGVPAGSPLLVLRRMSSASGVPAEDMTSACRGDLYHVTMQMDRNIPVPASDLPDGGSR
ncbi:MAG: UTRA domain-containing protein [Sciscionella sp.]